MTLQATQKLITFQIFDLVFDLNETFINWKIFGEATASIKIE